MRQATEAFSAKRRSYQPEPEEQDQGDTMTCRAGGCSLLGSVSVGSTTGPFLCGFHAYADPALWPSISRALRDHDWMLGLMSDLRGMLSQGKRAEAIAFARE